MKGQVHDQMIENLRRRGILTEAIKEWNIPAPYRDGENVFGQLSVNRITQEMFDTMLRSMVAATMQHPSEYAATSHSSQRMHFPVQGCSY